MSLQRLGSKLVSLFDGTTLNDFITRDSYRRNLDVRGFLSDTNLSGLNAIVNTGNNKGQFKVPAGAWTGGVSLKSGYGIQGDNLISTTVVVPAANHGIEYIGTDIRGIKVSDLAMQVAGAVSGGPPIGSKCGMDLTACAKVVNCAFHNMYFDFFDIGVNTGPADFSNYYQGIRCNNNRIAYNLVSNGTNIQNVWDNCYAANWQAYGMLCRGLNNAIFNGFNFGANTTLAGAANAYFIHMDTNSRGIVYNNPNFEMDAGKLAAGGQAIRIASASEATFNYPVFNKCVAAGANMYLYRIGGSATVHINNPLVYNDDGTAGHLSVEDNATVYLYDPMNNFTVIRTTGNGKLIRVKQKLDNTPDFTSLTSVTSGTIVTIGFYPRHVEAQCNYAASGVVGSEKYIVIFDSYTSTTGTATARVVDTTTGTVVTGITRSVFIKAWR